MNARLSSLLTGLLLSFPVAACAVEYQVIDLGTLGGEASAANALNDRAQAVGWALDADGRTNAFIWQNGTLASLGFLPGGSHAIANAINRDGVATGQANVSPTNIHAFVWSDGTMTSIGTLGGSHSIGRGISDPGDITGSSGQTLDAHNHTFVWRDDQLIHITPYHNFYSCDAFDINADGIVCGITALWATNDRWWAYVWFDANGNGMHDAGEMMVLGSLGTIYSRGSMSGAHAINDSGQVVGWTSVTNSFFPQHAFLVTPSGGRWKIPEGSPDPANTLMQSLGVLGGPTNNSWARGINNRTWIVGTADMPAGTNQAFLWRNGAMLNLNHLIAPDSGWVLTHANGINDHNEIVGQGLVNGQTRAFLLRREGRITDVETLGWTETWTFTNEFAEVVTGENFHAESQVLHWSGIWHSDPEVPHVFTVESCIHLQNHDWAPVPPEGQWPSSGFSWTNQDLDSSRMRFFRVRADPAE